MFVNPQTVTSTEIDLYLLERKLWNLRRFQGHPDALVVRQHTHLVRALAIRDNAPPEVVDWSFHHDDHEGIVGDLNGLIVRKINTETGIYEAICDHVDRVICDARGMDWPTKETQRLVYRYDKMAESIEMRIAFGWRVEDYHPEWPEWLTEDLATRLYRTYRDFEGPD